MRYPNITKATFISRPNRFIARVELDGKVETVHVKNTGRCREILTEGADVYLVRSSSPARKTAYDLVAVRKGERVVNMDSRAPNRAVEEWLKENYPENEIRRESVHGDSRFDFQMKDAEGNVTFIEVKGVTLEDDGHARFPDAPTQRGVKHLNGLIQAVREGNRAMAIFVVQMSGMKDLSPNWDTHPEFGETLRRAADAGVDVRAFECTVSPDSMAISGQIPVILEAHPNDR